MNVVVTGASRGIGFSIAKKMLTEGHRVIAIARSETNLNKLKVFTARDKEALYVFPFDLSNGHFKNTLFPFVSEKFNRIDIVINNAGLLISKAFTELTDEDFDNLFFVNVKSAFKIIRDLYPLFGKDTHIVNIISMGGFQGSAKFHGLSLYSAAKGAVAILTESLAEEFKEKEIKVNALALGAVQTEMLAQAFPNYKAPITSSKIAEFIVDFALKGHRFFNGKILPVSSTTP